jgi:Fe-S cluster biogenesis protein NfuA
MALLGRGVPSCSSSITEGAVRATMASISAEPESEEVRLLLAGACLGCGMQIRSCLGAGIK